jgi:hypothetical protein
VPEKSRLIKQLSLLISVFAAVFLVWVALSRGYFNHSSAQPSISTQPISTQSKATPIPVPTFNAAMIDVLIHDSYYGDTDTNLTKPPVWTVPANSDVILNLDNKGKLKHNWAIVKKGAPIPSPYQEGQGGDILLFGVGMVYHNSKTTVTFSAPEPGEYVVICTVSGHYPMMQGRLVVK